LGHSLIIHILSEQRVSFLIREVSNQS